MRQYRKVSSETCSRISSKFTPRVARPIAYSAKGAISEEVLKTSRAVHTARANVSQETRRAKASAHDQSDGENQFRRLFPLQTL